MLKPIYNNYLIKPIIDGNPLRMVGLNGEPLVVNPKFEPLMHTPQYGQIVELPISYNKKYRLLPKDAFIFFSYLVCEEYKKVVYDGVDYFFCGVDMVWGSVWDINKYELGLEPTENYIIAELVIDETLMEGEMILREHGERENQKLKAHTIHPSITDIMEGDTLITLKGAGTPIHNSPLVFVKTNNILGVERNNVIIPVKGKHLIEEDDITDYAVWKGLIVTEAHRHKFQTGTYLDGDNKELIGRKVTFIHGFSTRLNLNGKKYAVVTNRDLIFTT